MILSIEGRSSTYSIWHGVHLSLILFKNRKLYDFFTLWWDVGIAGKVAFMPSELGGLFSCQTSVPSYLCVHCKCACHVHFQMYISLWHRKLFNPWNPSTHSKQSHHPSCFPALCSHMRNNTPLLLPPVTHNRYNL